MGLACPRLCNAKQSFGNLGLKQCSGISDIIPTAENDGVSRKLSSPNPVNSFCTVGMWNTHTHTHTHTHSQTYYMPLEVILNACWKTSAIRVTCQPRFKYRNLSTSSSSESKMQKECRLTCSQLYSSEVSLLDSFLPWKVLAEWRSKWNFWVTW
jgi:hypothetical protein